MARSAMETARRLMEMYDERFGGDECERFRIGWPELRQIAGVKRLTPGFLQEISDALHEDDYLLAIGGNFFVVAREADFNLDRTVPHRLVERYRHDAPEEPEDIETDDDDDVMIDDEEE